MGEYRKRTLELSYSLCRIQFKHQLTGRQVKTDVPNAWHPAPSFNAYDWLVAFALLVLNQTTQEIEVEDAFFCGVIEAVFQTLFPKSRKLEHLQLHEGDATSEATPLTAIRMLLGINENEAEQARKVAENLREVRKKASHLAVLTRSPFI